MAMENIQNITSKKYQQTTGCQKGAASPPDGRQDTSETAQFHWFGLAIALCHEGQGDFSIVRLHGTKDGHGMDGWMAL
jgi:hypothetical protein